VPRLNLRGGYSTLVGERRSVSLAGTLLASAAAAISVAVATPAALANGLSFTNYTTTNGLVNNTVRGVYASGSSIYAATYGGLSISTNNGTSWSNYTTANGLGDNYVDGVYASGGSIYAATDGGLSISTNGGSSWTNYTTADGLSKNVRGVYVSGDNVYAATIPDIANVEPPNFPECLDDSPPCEFTQTVVSEGGLSIAQLPASAPNAVPGPLPLFGAASAFGFSRKLRRRLRAAAGTSC